ncbi:uncharacterized protein LOC143735317 isoform X2 [Siphateles boraxobius]|uniref:uncharacterized protein LOC143735317 isoform X2 n=1 Tax=Siphateles boraxobius TaxID=180520 RepID=UPI0040646A47
MENISLFFMSVVFMEGVFSETRSVKAGESITLHTGLTEIQKDEVMDWTFGAEQNLIARVRKENNPTIYNEELNGKFNGRLELSGQTGDLTILNTRSSDAGVYEVSNSINSFRKSISVSVRSGLSPGAIAGIVIGVIVLVAAAAVGIYFGYKKKGQMYDSDMADYEDLMN